MDYTIVGGGIAAASAMRGIREHDPGGRITVIGEEPQSFYYRPLTPLVVRGDRTAEEILAVPGPQDIRFVHDRVVALAGGKKEIRLASGAGESYERLLIATGSAPVVPEVPGAAGENVYCLRTLADAEKLKAAAGEARRAVVLGGGLVGLKTAGALKAHGVDVTVIEQMDHLLSPRLDREAAAMVAARLEEEGISLITADTAAEILADGVRLASGRELPADLVCAAVGVAPNTEWLAGSGLAVEKALVVNEKMETSLPWVYGAGDVVQTRDLLTGGPLVSGLWTNAVEMGRAAGVNMAGGKRVYPGALAVLNATEIAGLPMISAGDVQARTAGCEVVCRREGDRYRKLVFAGDRLIGVLFVGDLKNAGVYTALIRNQTPLGPLRRKAAALTLSYADFAVAAPGW